MSKKDPQASLQLTSDQHTWVTCASQGKPFEVPHYILETAEEIEFLHNRELRAAQGDLTALADLIRAEPRYFGTTWFMETVRVLRGSRRLATTIEGRTHATKRLKLLADALCGGAPGKGLKGKQPHLKARDVSRLYALLLPAYQLARRGAATGPVVLASFVRYGALWRFFSECDPTPEGITPLGGGGRTGGKVRLNTPPFFTIPEADLARLKSELPSEVVLERLKALLRIGRGGEDLKWIRKLVAAGRKKLA